MDKQIYEIKCQLIKVFTDIGILFYLEKNGEQVARVKFLDNKNVKDLREVDDAN